MPPPGYLEGVRELCTRHGIVFIADEVMAGFGRTGKWFAVEHFDVVPDLLTFAKGVNSGYVPLGGVAISPEIAATFGKRVYPGGLTYSGHPLATAAAVATINAMEDEGIVETPPSWAKRHRPRPGRLCRTARVSGRGPRHRRVLGHRARQGPDHTRATGALRRLQPGDERARRGVQIQAACCRSPTSTGSTWSRRCNTSVQDTEAGLAILDDVLEIADQAIA